MKLELKLISLVFCLGLFSLPVKSTSKPQSCPPGSSYCGVSGTCCIDECPCSQKVMRLKGSSKFIYSLPEGTSFYCENGQARKLSETEGASYYVCSLETSSRYAKRRQSPTFTPQADTAYSLGENIAVQCATGEPTPNGNLWTCPKASK